MNFYLGKRFGKIHFIILVGFVSLIILYAGVARRHFPGTTDSKERDSERANYSLYNAPGDLLKTSTCKIPDFDPWDSLVKDIYSQSSNVKHCPKASVPFFITATVSRKSHKSVPHLNEGVLWKFYRLRKHNLHCTYRAIVRDETARVRDGKFRFQEKRELLFDGQVIDAEYIWIDCYRYAFRKKFYEQPLLLAQGRAAKNASSKLNVLILGFDAVSRLNFHRQLKKTRELLLVERAETTVELLGYNKVGLNSGPNQIPLLTGKRFRPNGLYETVKNRYVDNMTTYIWDEYQEAGYNTLFFEEQWNYGLFVWPELKGFYRVPTDYWPRPIMQAIDKSDSKLKFGAGLCIGSKPAAATYLNYVLDIFRVSTNPLWLYAWFSELSHDEFAGAQRADELFHDFFVTLAREGFMENTVIFFLADHGFRFGHLRHFPLGRYEDQLPFGFVLLPEKMGSKFTLRDDDSDVGVIRERLYENAAHRLITVYDLHKTIRELVVPPPVAAKRLRDHDTAYNIFTEEIPFDRTCEQARIDFEYCSCHHSADAQQPLEPTLKFELGNLLLSKLNDELDRYNDSKCERWKLKSVDEASLLMENPGETSVYRVAVSTLPDANFEACIQHRGRRTGSDGRSVLMSAIDRTDFYSENARCVIPSPYEKYCHCK